LILGPYILYAGGFRYNKPNHILHYYLMWNSQAYFIYDFLVEIYDGTADLITNLHHVIVIGGSFFHMQSHYAGWEFVCNICVIDTHQSPT